jgi:hypothetical protein
VSFLEAGARVVAALRSYWTKPLCADRVGLLSCLYQQRARSESFSSHLRTAFTLIGACESSKNHCTFVLGVAHADAVVVSYPLTMLVIESV